LKSLALPNHRYLSPMSGRHWRRARVEKHDLMRNEVCEALNELRDPPHYRVDDSGDDGSGVDFGAVSAKAAAN